MSHSLYASKTLALYVFCLFSLFSFQLVFAAAHKSHHVAHHAQKATPTPENPFKTPFDTDSSTDSSDEDITPTDDGPTPDRSPGLGIEFETSSLELHSSTCKLEGTLASKGKEISGHTNTYWSLTVDTTAEVDGKVKGEYILNGKEIKLGAGTAAPAAENVQKDLVKWKPHATMSGNSFDLLDPVSNECKTWKVYAPSSSDGYQRLVWQVQATAPMPLAGLYALFELAKTSPRGTDPLLAEGERHLNRMVWVNSEFFQNSPQGNAATGVNTNTLAFLSLIVSYVKSTNILGESIKFRSAIMPRTDFVTIYDAVKSNIQGNLYELVLALLCFRNYEDEVELDSVWCDGTLKEPKLLPRKSEELTFQIQGKSPLSNFKDRTSFTLQDWMEGLQGTGTMAKNVNEALKKTTTAPVDLMAVFDRWYDGQIGAYGSIQEHLYGNSKQSVPLFEFRNLEPIKADSGRNLFLEATQGHYMVPNSTTKSTAIISSSKSIDSGILDRTNANTRWQFGEYTPITPDTSLSNIHSSAFIYHNRYPRDWAVFHRSASMPARAFVFLR
ncbi:hypothetical protein BO78DRAFT_427094 [Aspergillus sclerotiicarbonarius CBS 121057]|uniref:Uncharacterized protein n=1 Tax=Aspergillus sclerotiicarbonarius (strain CBS 121057 / IBT 28362) TaxID=1448318 RepID=A0A319EHC4_ASPSB|nr:hypothetical protein BO78DRAFT_427094 [Aspergillus sclerotiicarbonarius CBS 121057]